MARSTEDMIHDLARNLPPVTPMRRLREIVVMALGVSLPFYILRLGTAGFNDRLTGSEPPGLVFLLVSAILVLVAVGGLLAGLAGAIPGRETTSRFGMALTLFALAAIAGAFGYSMMFEPASIAQAAKGSVACALGAAMLAIPAAWFVTRFVVRGAARAIPSTMALATAGGMGAAAAIIHATCPHPDSLHLILGHGLAPFVGGLIVLTCASIYYALREGRRGPNAAS